MRSERYDSVLTEENNMSITTKQFQKETDLNLVWDFRVEI